MMEDVEEPAEGRIFRVLQPLAGVVGEVDGQWPVGPKEPEESDLKPGRLPVAQLERTERGRREREVGILAQPDRLVERPFRLPPAWLVRVQALDPPQRLVEIVAVGRRSQRPEER